MAFQTKILEMGPPDSIYSYPPPSRPLFNLPPVAKSVISHFQGLVVQNHPLAQRSERTPTDATKSLPLVAPQDRSKRRPEDGDLRLKAVYVTAPDREEYDKNIASLRDQARKEREEKEKLGAQLEHLQKQFEEAQRMTEQREAQINEWMKQQAEANVARIQEPGPVDEDEEMEEEEQIQAQLDLERSSHAREKEVYEKVIATQKADIAALVARTRRPPGARTDPPQAPFPPGPPVLVPRFVSKETREQRRTKVVRGNGRPLPSTSLRPAPAESEEDNEEDTVEGLLSALNLDDPACVAMLAKAVDAVFQKLGIQAITVASTQREKGRRSRRAPSKRTSDIREQQAKMTREEDLWCKHFIRRVWRHKYSMDTAAEFAAYVPAATKLVERCNDGIEGPAPDQFTLDFSTGYRSSLWNAAIIEKFTVSIQAARRDDPNGWGVPDISDEYISGELFNQLKQSQEAWAKWCPRLLPGTIQMENEAQIAARVKQTDKKRRQRATQNSAKARSSDEPDLVVWEYLKNVLMRLGKDGMSSEEEGVDTSGLAPVPVYFIKLCIWRADPLADYMDLIDKSIPDVKAAKGTPLTPRIRKPSNGLGSSAAPPGLPRKMYDEFWLAEQEEKRPFYVKETLRVSKDAFEFLITVADKGKSRTVDEEDV
ncbi:hypothetical protein B0H11DRAFT_1910112 [Mycena galericulata]|nr:hypothetical protein B0H11DRAFT_1910112 [Mycena galericulata]